MQPSTSPCTTDRTSSRTRSSSASGSDTTPRTTTAEAVTSTQDWAELGAQNLSKDETGTISCAAAAWSGDSTTTPRRAAIAKLLSDLEAAHRADITLGGAVMFSNFAAGNLHQQLTTSGNEVLALFTVTFRSRI
jgi:hypothetical protein